jgi:hypothetical protein
MTDKLRAKAQLIRNYLITDHRLYLEREASDHRMPHPTNPFATDYLAFVEEIGGDMETRAIRAWHYTRLTDGEVDVIRERGIYPSTLDSLRRRLDAQVAAGSFAAAAADALYAASPFHHQLDSRSGKFWMTSHPIEIDDSGVTLLLNNWGGEATYFWLEDATLEKLVAGIGRPRVLEIAIPIGNTRHSYSAGKGVVATFARTLGCVPDRGGFDLYSIVSLEPKAVIAIQSESEPDFRSLAQGYPEGYAAE